MRLDEFMQFVRRLVGKGEEAVELVFEMQVESAVADACRLGNVLRPCLVIAALGEKSARSLHELSAAFELSLCPAAHGCRLRPACRCGRISRLAIFQNGRFCGFSGSGARFLRGHTESVGPY